MLPFGCAKKTREGNQITFTHTVVDLEGKGVGSALARNALDAVRALVEKAGK